MFKNPIQKLRARAGHRPAPVEAMIYLSAFPEK